MMDERSRPLRGLPTSSNEIPNSALTRSVNAPAPTPTPTLNHHHPTTNTVIAKHSGCCLVPAFCLPACLPA
ncbi:hypothetical protein M0802_003731 [Mischocyttarus mexicanus]|nr:hypothetical protein M0802_003731 [Mischocyttarus mexicanus]